MDVVGVLSLDLKVGYVCNKNLVKACKNLTFPKSILRALAYDA